jgi:hypothetical protein
MYKILIITRSAAVFGDGVSVAIHSQVVETAHPEEAVQIMDNIKQAKSGNFSVEAIRLTGSEA